MFTIETKEINQSQVPPHIVDLLPGGKINQQLKDDLDNFDKRIANDKKLVTAFITGFAIAYAIAYAIVLFRK